MDLTWRLAVDSDLALLAEWNHQLIRDEGHRNPMSASQLADRMRGWLTGEYKAVVFSKEVPVAYALYSEQPDEIYLRQFFVDRTLRRTGIGSAALEILRRQVWPAGVRLTVEVLCGNPAAASFWRKSGYQDYSLRLEILP